VGASASGNEASLPLAAVDEGFHGDIASAFQRRIRDLDSANRPSTESMLRLAGKVQRTVERVDHVWDVLGRRYVAGETDLENATPGKSGRPIREQFHEYETAARWERGLVEILPDLAEEFTGGRPTDP